MLLITLRLKNRCLFRKIFFCFHSVPNKKNFRALVLWLPLLQAPLNTPSLNSATSTRNTSFYSAPTWRYTACCGSLSPFPKCFLTSRFFAFSKFISAWRDTLETKVNNLQFLTPPPWFMEIVNFRCQALLLWEMRTFLLLLRLLPSKKPRRWKKEISMRLLRMNRNTFSLIIVFVHF